jgi:hypothetical protein
VLQHKADLVAAVAVVVHMVERNRAVKVFIQVVVILVLLDRDMTVDQV